MFDAVRGCRCAVYCMPCCGPEPCGHHLVPGRCRSLPSRGRTPAWLCRCPALATQCAAVLMQLMRGLSSPRCQLCACRRLSRHASQSCCASCRRALRRWWAPAATLCLLPRRESRGWLLSKPLLLSLVVEVGCSSSWPRAGLLVAAPHPTCHLPPAAQPEASCLPCDSGHNAWATRPRTAACCLRRCGGHAVAACRRGFWRVQARLPALPRHRFAPPDTLVLELLPRDRFSTQASPAASLLAPARAAAYCPAQRALVHTWLAALCGTLLAMALPVPLRLTR